MRVRMSRCSAKLFIRWWPSFDPTLSIEHCITLSHNKAMSRADDLNEEYYARDNNPSFYQFGSAYHFVDDAGRQYQLATRNRATFQNTRFKPRRAPLPARCVVNSYGYVTCFVKLAHGSKWFGARDINVPLLLREKRNAATILEVRVKQALKVRPTRRTGTVQLSGLSEFYCNALLLGVE